MVRPSRPSTTARTIAFARAVGSGGLADPLAARALGRSGPAVAGVLRRLAATPVVGGATSLAMAGLNVHAALRMAAVDRAITAAVTDGCRQLVVVGAGFDTRAWRIPALADVAVLEVDLPATQQAKQEALRDLPPITRPTFLAADLSTDDLGDVLAAGGHDPAAPTVWLWEAVVPYLPPSAVGVTLATLAGRSTGGSRLVLTFANPPGGQGPLSPLREAAARAVFTVVGEPLRSTHDDFDIADAVVAAGFSAPEVTGTREWAAAEGRGPRSTPFAAERLLVAQRR